MNHFPSVIAMAILGANSMMNFASDFFTTNALESVSTDEISKTTNDNNITRNQEDKVPVPHWKKNIDLSDLGNDVIVKKMTYSPDGRYLAIVVNPMHLQTDIVIWDMEPDKKLSHIHCPYNYGDLSDHQLLWSRDGKVISFGAKHQWQALTGIELPDNPAIGRAARLNKDGSKMLTIVGAIGEPSTIHIYDTANWHLQKRYADGFAVETAAWTAEDKILMGVHVTKEVFGKTFDAHTIGHGPDVALRLLDPAGKEPTRALWFPAVPDDRPDYLPWKQSIDVVLSVSNFARNQIALGAGRLIDGNTLAITSYFSIDDIVHDKVSTGTGGMVFDPLGKYLYIKSAMWFDGSRPVENVIINTATGKQVGTFDGGDEGIAIRSDGRQLAIGNQRSVQILDVQ